MAAFNLKAFKFVVVFLMTSLIIFEEVQGNGPPFQSLGPDAALDLSCEDRIDRFDVVLPSGKVIKRTCKWVETKRDWRCTFQGAKEACRNTCDQCHIPYWCVNTDKKFHIRSLSWIKSEKSCSWAQKKKFIFGLPLCRIVEVKENCPALCNFCKCLDNLKRFDVLNSDTRFKSCKWAGRINTDTRCQNPIIQENCPLTCGECDLFPVVLIEMIISIELEEATLPTDEEDLAKCENILMEAFTSFLPSTTKVTNIDLVRTSAGTPTPPIKFYVEDSLNCSNPGVNGCDEDKDNYFSAMETAISAAVSSGSTGLGALAEAAAATSGIPLTISPTGEYSDQSNVSIKPFKKATESPTATPSQVPSEKPSTPPPTNSPTNNPTNGPTGTPTKLPTKQPSLGPSNIASESPSSAPSQNPSSTPSQNPSNSPSQDPFSAFQDRSHLRSAATTWCQNPNAWKAGATGYDTYGYVSFYLIISIIYIIVISNSPNPFLVLIQLFIFILIDL